MAAIYFNIKKNRGFINKLNNEAQKLKSIQLHSLLKTQTVKEDWEKRYNRIDFERDSEDRAETTQINEVFDPLFLLKKLSSNISNSYIEKVIKRIKIVDTISAIISFIAIVISIFEYETYYFPHYVTKEKSEYKGQGYRITLSALSLILVISSYVSCYLTFYVKYEKKKCQEGKILK